MPNVPAATPAPKPDIPVNADLAWGHLTKVLFKRLPNHLAGTAAARKRLNATRRGR